MMKKSIQVNGKKITVLAFLFLAGFFTLQAQIADTLYSLAKKTNSKVKVIPAPKPRVIPTPEYINQPSYYDEPDNKLTRLEVANAKITTRKKTLGLKGAKQYYTIEGATSKIRFTSSKNNSFIIKTNGDMMDLSSFIKLYKFTTVDDKRETLLSEKDGVIKNKEESKNATIVINVKKIGYETFMIMPAQTLEAGEYAFVLQSSANASQELVLYAFGIEWKKSD